MWGRGVWQWDVADLRVWASLRDSLPARATGSVRGCRSTLSHFHLVWHPVLPYRPVDVAAHPEQRRLQQVLDCLRMFEF